MCDSVESYTIGAKYRTVKKRLDSLGYKHSLSLDSLSLVEQLLADLIKTTESLKHFKSVAANNTEVDDQLTIPQTTVLETTVPRTTVPGTIVPKTIVP
ncbi:Similar to Cep135: Centrosomal protein of 135 kDa (Mus musculus) [Cotesia congregata]|uniref:Similar to Cep135: Centrosomal protein of 135 kDa (Mus musculus) n=1 Tax=Cotesia congregata TaxID=51543 RepID=A0A8J2EBX2_COTCN|nr:Similar to Cep135: Centrosomal protein of 135 kDa (Mus musculus) [Cotesia congregata]